MLGKVSITFAKAGESTQGTFTVGGAKIKVIKGEQEFEEDAEVPFLVRTRQNGSLIDDPPTFNFELTSDQTADWTIEVMARPGPDDAFTTIREATAEDQGEGSITLDLHDAGEWDDLSADARAEDGRGQDPFRIRFEATLEDEEDPDPVVVEQDQGAEGEFSVIRQEYEDTEKTSGNFLGSAPGTQFTQAPFSSPMPPASAFGTEDHSDIYNLLTVGSFDFNGQFGIFQRTMGEGLDTVTQEMRQIRDDQGNQLWPNFRFDMASVAASMYRNPAFNVSLSPAAGWSTHIYGRASDVLIADLSTQQKLKLYGILQAHRDDLVGSFDGDESPNAFVQETDPHINWEPENR